MSQTQNIRFSAIDRALRRRPAGSSWQELAAACHASLREFDLAGEQPPSRRTILEDIKRMRQGLAGEPAPIEYRKGRGYYYSNRSFTLQPLPLEPHDLLALSDLADWAAQLTYGQLPTGFAATVERLARHLRTRVRALPSSLLLDRPGGLEGREHLTPLHHAVLNRQCIRVQYADYEVPMIEATLSPYLLKEYNRRWFVLAYHHEPGRIWTFPLDRIARVEAAPLTDFHNDPRLQPHSWLNDVVGVIRPPNTVAQTIRLRVTPLQACYLRTKPLHASQREVSAEPPEFELRLIPNPELEMQLLSFGEAVEVLQPLELRVRLATRLREALAHYDD